MIVQLEAQGGALIVVSRPCRRSCEARESALLNLLLYISYDLSYCIGDVQYTYLKLRQFNRNRLY